MREDLLGYLLGALEPDEQRRVSDTLARDPQLRRELEALESELGPLRPPLEDEAPPPGLAERTIALVNDFRPAPAGRPSRELKPLTPASPHEAVSRRDVSLLDVIVSGAICLCAAALFFPAIAGSHHKSRILACQDNLREIGMAIAGYNDIHDGRQPVAPAEGNRAAAGVVAPTLLEGGLVDGKERFVCPATALAARREEHRIPTLAEIDEAHGPRLIVIHQTMGGSYGYQLGYIEGEVYRIPRNERRTTFAIVSDAPSPSLPGYRSGNHGGRGQNVLYEDFHVEYVVECTAGGDCRDSMFTNRLGQVGAGLGPHDIVIGWSSASPGLRFVGSE